MSYILAEPLSGSRIKLTKNSSTLVAGDVLVIRSAAITGLKPEDSFSQVNEAQIETVKDSKKNDNNCLLLLQSLKIKVLKVDRNQTYTVVYLIGDKEHNIYPFRRECPVNKGEIIDKITSTPGVGCNDPSFTNYSPEATGGGTCYNSFRGCTDPAAMNYNEKAFVPDVSSPGYPSFSDPAFESDGSGFSGNRDYSNDIYKTAAKPDGLCLGQARYAKKERAVASVAQARGAGNEFTATGWLIRDDEYFSTIVPDITYDPGSNLWNDNTDLTVYESLIVNDSNATNFPGYGLYSAGYGSFSASNFGEPHRLYALHLNYDFLGDNTVRVWIECSEAVAEIIANQIANESQFSDQFGGERWNMDVPFGASAGQATTSGDGPETQFNNQAEVIYTYTAADVEYLPGGYSFTDEVYVATTSGGGLYNYYDTDCSGLAENTSIVANCTEHPFSTKGKVYRVSCSILFGTVNFITGRRILVPDVTYQGETNALILGEPNVGDGCNHGDYCFEGQYYVENAVEVTTSWNLDDGNGAGTHVDELNVCHDNYSVGSHTVTFTVNAIAQDPATGVNITLDPIVTTYEFTVGTQVDGCTDPNAQNFNGLATCDDGSCLYFETVCSDNNSQNDAAAGFPCTLDVGADNYVAPTSNTIHDQSTCRFTICTDPTASNYFDYTQFPDVCGNWESDNAVCTYTALAGCTDASAFNYEPTATVDDGSCYAINTGCIDPNAYNFNDYDGDGYLNFLNPDPSVNINTHDSSTCIYRGCIDHNATNGNPTTILQHNILTGFTLTQSSTLPYNNWIYAPHEAVPEIGDTYGGGTVVSITDNAINPVAKDLLIISTADLTPPAGITIPSFDVSGWVFYHNYDDLTFEPLVPNIEPLSGPDALRGKNAWDEIYQVISGQDEDADTNFQWYPYAQTHTNLGVSEGWYLPSYTDWQFIRIAYLDDKLPHLDPMAKYWYAATFMNGDIAVARFANLNNWGDSGLLFQNVRYSAKVRLVRRVTVQGSSEPWIVKQNSTLMSSVADSNVIDAPLDENDESLCNYALTDYFTACAEDNFPGLEDSSNFYEVEEGVINTSGELTGVSAITIGANHELVANQAVCCLGALGIYNDGQMVQDLRQVSPTVGSQTTLTNINSVLNERVKVQVIDFEHPILYLGRFNSDLAVVSYDLAEQPITHSGGATGNVSGIDGSSLGYTIETLAADGWSGNIYPKYSWYFRVRSAAESTTLGLALKPEFKTSTGNLSDHPMNRLFGSNDAIASIQAYYMGNLTNDKWDTVDINELTLATELVDGTVWDFPIGYHPNANSSGKVLSTTQTNTVQGGTVDCSNDAGNTNEHGFIVYKVTLAQTGGKDWGVLENSCVNAEINFFDVFQGQVKGCTDQYANDSLFPLVDTNSNGIPDSVLHANYDVNATLSNPPALSTVENDSLFATYTANGGCYHFACTNKLYVEYDSSDTAINPNDYMSTTIPEVGTEALGGEVIEITSEGDEVSIIVVAPLLNPSYTTPNGNSTLVTGDYATMQANVSASNQGGYTDWQLVSQSDIEHYLYQYAKIGPNHNCTLPVWSTNPIQSGSSYLLQNLWDVPNSATSNLVSVASGTAAALMFRKHIINTSALTDEEYCKTLKVYGCTDPAATNYNPDANFSETSFSDSTNPCSYDINLEPVPCSSEVAGEYDKDNLDRGLLFFAHGNIATDGTITSSGLVNGGLNCFNIENTPYITKIKDNFPYFEKNHDYIEVCQIISKDNFELNCDDAKTLGSYTYIAESNVQTASGTPIGTFANIHPDSIDSVVNHFNTAYSGTFAIQNGVSFFFRIDNNLKVKENPETLQPYTTVEILNGIFNSAGALVESIRTKSGVFYPGDTSSTFELQTGSSYKSQALPGQAGYSDNYPDGYITTAAGATDVDGNTCNSNAKFPAYHIYKVIANPQFCGKFNFSDYYEEAEPAVLGCMDECAANYNPDATFPSYYPQNSGNSSCVYDFGEINTELNENVFQIVRTTGAADRGCEDTYTVTISPAQSCVPAATGVIQICILYSATANGSYLEQFCLEDIEPCDENYFIPEIGGYGIESFTHNLLYDPFPSDNAPDAIPNTTILPNAGYYKIQVIVTNPDYSTPDETDTITNTIYESEAISVGIFDDTNTLEIVSEGCMDDDYVEFDPAHTCSDQGQCQTLKVYGCTDPNAFNFNEEANTDDGSCYAVVEGCLDPNATNYVTPLGILGTDVNTDNGSCYYCTLAGEGTFEGLFTHSIFPIGPTAQDSQTTNFEALATPLVTDEGVSTLTTEAMQTAYNAVLDFESTYNNVSNQLIILNYSYDPTGAYDGSGNSENDSTSELFSNGNVTVSYLNATAGSTYIHLIVSNYPPGLLLPAPYAITDGTDTYLASTITTGWNTDFYTYNDGNCAVPIVGSVYTENAPVGGCTDETAFNHDELANFDDGSCIPVITGCCLPEYDNYQASIGDPQVDINTCDASLCAMLGCTNPDAENYNEFATQDDGSCIILGCTDSTAQNYNASANTADLTYSLFESELVSCTGEVIPLTSNSWWRTYQNDTGTNSSSILCNNVNTGSDYRLSFFDLHDSTNALEIVSYAIASPQHGIWDELSNSPQFASDGTNLTLEFDVLSATFNQIEGATSANIGDELAGGIIFDFSPDGSKAYVVAPDDYVSGDVVEFKWAEDCATAVNTTCSSLPISGSGGTQICTTNPDGTGTSKGLFDGLQNTLDIVASCDSGTCTNSAAYYAQLYSTIDSAGTEWKDGWHLPSKDALEAIANNLLGSGIMTYQELNISPNDVSGGNYARYWSSSEKGLTTCVTSVTAAYEKKMWELDNNAVGVTGFTPKGSERRIRAVKEVPLTSTSGSLELYVYSKSLYDSSSPATHFPSTVFDSTRSIKTDDSGNALPVFQITSPFIDGPALSVSIPYTALPTDNFEWVFLTKIKGSSGSILIDNIKIVTPGLCVVSGCTNINALNYNADATSDDGSCIFGGCLDDGTSPSVFIYDETEGSVEFQITSPTNNTGQVIPASNYTAAAGVLHIPGSCHYVGCMDPTFEDAYNAAYTISDPSACFTGGCTDPNMDNYNENATHDDGSCYRYGCTDSDMDNYDNLATIDDGSCIKEGCFSWWADNYDAKVTYQSTTACTFSGCYTDWGNTPSYINVHHSINQGDALVPENYLNSNIITAINAYITAHGNSFMSGINGFTGSYSEMIQALNSGTAWDGVGEHPNQVGNPSSACDHYGCTDAADFNTCTECDSHLESVCVATVEGCLNTNAVNYVGSGQANTPDGSCCFTPTEFDTFEELFTTTWTCSATPYGVSVLFAPTSSTNIYGISSITIKSIYRPDGTSGESDVTIETTTKDWYNGSTGWWDLKDAGTQTVIDLYDGTYPSGNAATHILVSYNYNTEGTDGAANYSGANTCAFTVTTAVPSDCALMPGCTDSLAWNYDETANEDDGSCIDRVYGCTDATAFNYNSAANTDDGSCYPVILGCTDSTAFNFIPLVNNVQEDVNTDDGSCIAVVGGCLDSTDSQYDPTANTDDGSCCGNIEPVFNTNLNYALVDRVLAGTHVIDRGDSEGILIPHNTGGDEHIGVWGKQLKVTLSNSLTGDIQALVDAGDLLKAKITLKDANNNEISSTGEKTINELQVNGATIDIYNSEIDSSNNFTAGHPGSLTVFETSPKFNQLGTGNNGADLKTTFSATASENGYFEVTLYWNNRENQPCEETQENVPYPEYVWKQLNFGCTHAAYAEFDPTATINDGSCATLYNFGCTTPGNFNTITPSCSPEFPTEYGDLTQCMSDFIAGITPNYNNETALLEYTNQYGPCASNVSITGEITGDTFDPCWQETSPCVPEILGCTDPVALNYNDLANTDDGSCTMPILGCTDEAYLEFDAAANTDDGSCTNLIVEGCMDENYLEFNEDANVSDQSQCITEVVFGCTDNSNVEYDPAANTDDGSCGDSIVLGCTDPTSCNYVPNANIEDGSCSGTIVCTDQNFLESWYYTSSNGIYNLTSPIPVGLNCSGYAASESYPDGYNPYPAGPVSELCVTPLVYGCTDSNSDNYNELANVDDFSCIEKIEGCTDSTAFNFNIDATIDDGSCYPVIEGCMNPLAYNYVAPTGDLMTDVNTEDGSCITEIFGCTDETASNYNPDADTDNGSCQYIENATCEGDIITLTEECALDGTSTVNIDYTTTSGLTNVTVFNNNVQVGTSSECNTPTNTTIESLTPNNTIKIFGECSFQIDHYSQSIIADGTATLPNEIKNTECGQTSVNPNTKIVFFYDTTSLGEGARSSMYNAANQWVKNMQSTAGFTGEVYHVQLFGERWVLWSAWLLDNSIDLDGINSTANLTACGDTDGADAGFLYEANIAAETNWVNDASSYVQASGSQGGTKALPAQMSSGDNILSVIFADESSHKPNKYNSVGVSMVPEQNHGGYHYEDVNNNNNVVITSADSFYNVQLPQCSHSTDFGLRRSLWAKDYATATQTIYNHNSGSGDIKTFVYPSQPSGGVMPSHRVFPMHIWMAINSGYQDSGLLAPGSSSPSCNIASLTNTVQNANGTNSNPYREAGLGMLDKHGFGANVTCAQFNSATFQNDLSAFVGMDGISCNDDHCYTVQVTKKVADETLPVAGYNITINSTLAGSTDAQGIFEFTLNGTASNNTLNGCHVFDSFGGCAISMINLGVVEESHVPSLKCVIGCTDVNAVNYDAEATVDDGSCTYCPQAELEEYISLVLTPASTAVSNDGHAAFAIEETFIETYFQGSAYKSWFAFNPNIGEYNPAIHEANINPYFIYVDTSTNPHTQITSTTDITSDTIKRVWGSAWGDGQPSTGQCLNNTNCHSLYAGHYAIRLDNVETAYQCSLSHFFEITVVGLGCTDPNATNYDPNATVDNNLCYTLGCTHSGSADYNPSATVDDGSCTFLQACTDSSACNWVGYEDFVTCTSDGCYTNELYLDANGVSTPGLLYVNDNTCTYAAPNRNCDGTCINPPLLANGEINVVAQLEGLCNEDIDTFCHDPNAINFQRVGNRAITLPREGTFARTSTVISPPSLRIADDDVCIYDNECVPDDIASILDALNRTIVDHSKSVLTKMKTGMITTEEYETLWRLILVDYLVAKVGLDSLYNCQNYEEFGKINYTGENYLDKFITFAFKVGDEHFTQDLKTRIRSNAYSRTTKTRRRK